MPSFLSMATKSTPYRISWQASERPVGPAPTMITSVLTGVDIFWRRTRATILREPFDEVLRRCARNPGSLDVLSYKFLRHLANANCTALNNPGVDAAQMQLSSHRGIHKLHCVETKAGDEFLAAGVRWRCHFNHRGTDRQLRSSGQVFGAEIHIQVKLITGQLPSFLML